MSDKAGPIPVEITIGDETDTRYITGFEVDHRSKDPVTITLDTSEEVSLSPNMVKELLKSVQEWDNE